MSERVRKVRLDQLLVERGDAPTREKAQRMIRAGQVREGTRVLDKPGVRVAEDVELDVRALRDTYVGRGGHKLEGAFRAFPDLAPPPAVCADIGASTGGFTDCLLQHGAEKVYAIDVGRGQLDASLRDDPRVVSMEGTNARHLTPGDLPEPVGLAVGDVSFISLRLILPAVLKLLTPGSGHAVFLVKPQFEAGPERVGKGGVVRDPAAHEDVLRDIALELPREIGMIAVGLAPSPIRGPAGNREYLLYLKQPGSDDVPIGADDVERAVGEAFSNTERNEP